MSSRDSFGSRSRLHVDGSAYTIFRLDAPALTSLAGARIDRLPISLRVLLENLLRTEDGKNVTAAAPGSAQGLYLIVTDIQAAREELLRRGVEVSEVLSAYAREVDVDLFDVGVGHLE